MSDSNIDIGNIHIKNPDVKLVEEDVHRVMDSLCEQTAVWEQHNGPARTGDKVLVEYRVTLNERVIEDTFGKPVEHKLLSASGHDAFNARFPGLHRGERLEFTVRRTKSRKKSSGHRTPGRYSVHIDGILRKNERKSRQALAALFGRKTIRRDTLFREVKQTMLARLDLIVRREVKSQVFNALYTGSGESPDNPRLDGAVDQTQYRAAVAEQIQDLIQKNEVNLDYDRTVSIVAALASRSENPESTERKYHKDIELLSRIEAAVLEDQIVEHILDHACVESTPIYYQAFIQATTNSTTPDPDNGSPRSSIVELTPATKCGYCSNSKCCQYITQKISTPRSKSDFNYLLWQASHENITIFQDDEGWNLLVTTRCSHLQTGGRCGIYATRPTVCRNYTNDYCEFEGPAEEGYKRCFHGYNELLEYCQQRFKHWDENAASQ